MFSSSKYKSLSQSTEYSSFRSKVPLRRVCIDYAGNKVWRVYDAGPRGVVSPLLCIPPAGGTADLFFRQLTAITKHGVRVLAVEYPKYTSVHDWCEGFRRLLDALGLETPHILGVSLGGFLAQMFSEHTRRCPRVASLLLCQSYCDSAAAPTASNPAAAELSWLLPAGALRGLVARIDHHGCEAANTTQAYNFAVEQLHSLSSALLSSRLALAASAAFVQPRHVQVRVTLLDVLSGCEARERAKVGLQKCFPKARLAYFKSSATLPFLVDSDMFHVYVMVHLKEFRSTKQDPFALQDNDQKEAYPQKPSPQDNLSQATCPEDTCPQNNYPQHRYNNKGLCPQEEACL